MQKKWSISRLLRFIIDCYMLCATLQFVTMSPKHNRQVYWTRSILCVQLILHLICWYVRSWAKCNHKNAALGYRGANCLSLCPFQDESTDVYQIWCQSVQPFDSFPSLLNMWPPNPPLPRHAPWGIEGWLVFSICPFPDESADVNQSWCQSVQPFDSFPWLLNVWPPKNPQVPPCVSQSNLFGVYPFPDESAHVYQMWCQSDQPFDIFPWLLILWPPNPPPPMSRGELYLAYVHSQTNPQTFTKFGVNRSSCLTASPDFWICDPLKPPGVLRGELYLAYVDSQTNPHICTKFGVNRSIRLTASTDFWICDPLKPPKMPPGILRGELCLAYVHSQTNPQTCTRFGANLSSRLTASPNIWICDPLNPPQIPLGYCGTNCS